jgi:hypothetical protein
LHLSQVAKGTVVSYAWENYRGIPGAFDTFAEFMNTFSAMAIHNATYLKGEIQSGSFQDESEELPLHPRLDYHVPFIYRLRCAMYGRPRHDMRKSNICGCQFEIVATLAEKFSERIYVQFGTFGNHEHNHEPCPEDITVSEGVQLTALRFLPSNYRRHNNVMTEFAKLCDNVVISYLGKTNSTVCYFNKTKNLNASC